MLGSVNAGHDFFPVHIDSHGPAAHVEQSPMRLIGEQLACQRGDRTVFAGLGFELGQGGLLVLTGPNGSGKTSLLRMIAGLIEPAAGRLTLHGGPPELSIGQQCHLVAHQDALKPALTALENLAFWGDFLGHGDVAAALAAFDLEALCGLQAGLLSAGQKRRLALSRLALTPRSLWLLDEPTVGLDQASQHRLSALMEAHLDRGGLMIVATHVGIGLEASQSIDLGEVAVAGS
jgi:heme exporter protein A